MDVFKPLEAEVDLTLKRVNAAITARKGVQTSWGKNFWDSVIAYLQRQSNRLN